jgi:SnoaL-like domain
LQADRAAETSDRPRKGRKPTKGYSVATLMMRNLKEVFGEKDSVRRRVVIDEIWNEDGVFYDPKSGAHRGRDEIHRIAGVIKAGHPEFQYQPISKPEVSGNSARVRWVSGRPGGPPSYAGTDFVIAKDGRLSAVYLFFDELP